MKQNQKRKAFKSKGNKFEASKDSKPSELDFEKIKKDIDIPGLFETLPKKGVPLSFSDLTKARYRYLSLKLKEFLVRKKN